MRNAALNFSVAKNAELRNAENQLITAFGALMRGKNMIPSIEVTETPVIETAVVTVLSNFELMAVAIHCGVADDTVAYEMHSGPVLQAVALFHEYINIRRDDNPAAFLHLTRLADDWRRRQVVEITPA